MTHILLYWDMYQIVKSIEYEADNSQEALLVASQIFNRYRKEINPIKELIILRLDIGTDLYYVLFQFNNYKRFKNTLKVNIENAKQKKKISK